MPNKRYINAVLSVKRIAPAPATIKEGTRLVKGVSDRVLAVSIAALHGVIAALANAAESTGFDDAIIAASYTDAANKALDAADALCVEANALAALATLYRENK